jgi:hypothetical protein
MHYFQKYLLSGKPGFLHVSFNTHNDVLFSFSIDYDLWNYILGGAVPIVKKVSRYKRQQLELL